MTNAYEKLVNEGGEGYTTQAEKKDSRTLEEQIFWAKKDLTDAELDGLKYKAEQLRKEVAALEAQL